MESERFATANFYRLDNQYLNQNEKLEVELWFQFPGTILLISFCICMIYNAFYPISIKFIMLIPLSLDFIFGLLNWFLNLRKILKLFFLTIGHNLILWALTVVTCTILIYYRLYIYSAAVFFAKVGLFTMISPSMWGYTLLAKKYKMHAKWVFFKKFYGYQFPFENEIEISF